MSASRRIMTELSRWTEYNEMCQEYLFESDTPQGVKQFVKPIESNAAWNDRYPDEDWFVFVRPAYGERNVHPHGMLPVFCMVMDPRDRYSDKDIYEIHQGTYDEMLEVKNLIKERNLANSKAYHEQNA